MVKDSFYKPNFPKSARIAIQMYLLFPFTSLVKKQNLLFCFILSAYVNECSQRFLFSKVWADGGKIFSQRDPKVYQKRKARVFLQFKGFLCLSFLLLNVYLLLFMKQFVYDLPSYKGKSQDFLILFCFASREQLTLPFSVWALSLFYQGSWHKHVRNKEQGLKYKTPTTF